VYRYWQNIAASGPDAFQYGPDTGRVISEHAAIMDRLCDTNFDTTSFSSDSLLAHLRTTHTHARARTRVPEYLHLH